MTLRTRLVLVVLPLLTLTIAAGLAVFAFRMSAVETSGVYRTLDARLSLLAHDIEHSWSVLARVGFDADPFYQSTVARSLPPELLADREGGPWSLVTDSHGLVLAGPPAWVGLRLPSTDSWHALLETAEGRQVVASPAFADGQEHLVVFRRFLPWDWVLATALPTATVWDALASGLVLASLVSFGLLTLATLVFALLVGRVVRPLAELTRVASRVGEGRLDLRAPEVGPEETRTLAREWNAMAERVEVLTSGLELQVAERTRELAEALDRTRRMQGHIILTEKLAGLGQLVGSIAHELNTPLGAIASAQSSFHELVGPGWTAQLEALATLDPADRQRLWDLLNRCPPLEASPDSRLRRRCRRELADRLAAAGVADSDDWADSLVEAGLTDWQDSDLAFFATPEGRAAVGALVSLALARVSAGLIGLAADKAGRVIQALRLYSRHDGRARRERIALAPTLDATLTLFQGRFRQGLEVVVDLDRSLETVADPDRLTQVWTNLVGNAVAVMGSTGRLEVSLARDGAEAVVAVTDSGPGIPPEVQSQIFTPFFTTKKAGEGSGLGLSISRNLIEEAGGQLTFTSVPGRTRFEARLPCP